MFFRSNLCVLAVALTMVGTTPAVSDETYLAQTDQVEITFWESVKDSADPAELKAYLAAYPDGKFAALARIRIERLENSKAEAPVDGEAEAAALPPVSPTDLGVLSIAPLNEATRAEYGVDEAATGVVVTEVVADDATTPVDVKVGDLVTEIDGAPVATPEEAVALVSAGKASKRRVAVFSVVSDGAEPRFAVIAFADLNVTAPQAAADAAAEPAPSAALETGERLAVPVRLKGYTDNEGRERGRLGVQISSVSELLGEAIGIETQDGALILDVIADGAGEAAGLKVADIVLAIDGRKVAGMADLVNIIQSYSPGAEIEVTVWRGEKGAETIIDLTKRLAESGNGQAAFELGGRYSNGNLVEKDEATAARYYRMGAEAGHPAAMTAYGYVLALGTGVAKNQPESVEWYRKAANAGDMGGVYQLAHAHDYGLGVTQDRAEATRWYRKAADAGNQYAMNRLGIFYEQGWGVGQDAAEAARWFQAASDKGHAESANRIGSAYFSGVGVPTDEAKGVAFFRKSAELGNGWGMFNLAMSLYNGNGVERDRQQAAKWVIEGLRKAGPGLAESVFEKSKTYDVATRKWLQRVLRNAGAYTGRIDGIFGPKVKQALEAVARQG